MSQKTGIQWTDSTCNPTMGCEGCELWGNERKVCYAGVLHQRHGGKNPGYSPTFEQLTPFPGRVTKACRLKDLRNRHRTLKPWLDGLPRLIFLSDMSDALSKPVSFAYLASEIIENVAGELGRRHQWQWLTKQPARMAKFSRWLAERDIDWPNNLWVGTSITKQATCAKRIAPLLEVGDKNTIRFLSVEPQWDEVDLREWLPKLDWVIQGGQSGAGAEPFDLAWARKLRDQCKKAGVAYFLKQLGSKVIDEGERIKFKHTHGGDWMQWPKDLRVREMPAIESATANKVDGARPRR